MYEPLAQSVEHLTFNQRVTGSIPVWLTSIAGVAELADALDLGSSVSRRGGSSPSTRTISSILRKYFSGRTPPCQGESRGFALRLPLQKSTAISAGRSGGTVA